ncbi:MAG: hypothetical protein P1V20_26325 [Verrucomicrobiales bacterium]|nr:hypothetical protein [Verrucomicrobiales bacterium]
MKLLSLPVLAAATLVIPGLALSGDYCFEGVGDSPDCGHTGYIFAYGGGFFGYDVEGHEPRFPSNEKMDMDSGYIFGGGGGLYLDFLNGSRLEVEGIHARNKIGRIRSDIFGGAGFVDYGFRGDVETNSVMVNLLKEIPFCNFTGYFGGGVGFAEQNITIYDPANQGNPESDAALTYQFIAGVDVPVSDCVDLFVQYKLIGINETHYERIDLVIDRHVTNNLVFGARMSF